MPDAALLAPASQTLMGARRAFVLVLSGYVVGVTIVVVVLRSANPGVFGWAVIASALVAYVLSVAVLRGEIQLWVAFASLASLLVLIFVVPNEDQQAWLPVPNLTGSLCYAAIVLGGRWWSLPWVTLGIGLTAYVFTVRPPHIVVWAPVMPEAILVLVQLGLACGGLWWMWQLLHQRARSKDAQFAAISKDTAAAIKRQERSRAWRRSAVTMHETILNTLRYVIGADRIEKERLKSFVAEMTDRAGEELAVSQLNLSTLVELIDASIGPGIRLHLEGSNPVEPINPHVAMALKDAISEVARNAQVHSSATVVTVRAEQADGAVRLVLVDNGTGVSDGWQPGIGLRRAIEQSVIEIGGSVEIREVQRRMQISIDLPTPVRSGTRSRPRVSFALGRLPITATLVGWVIGGFGVAVWLMIRQGIPAIPVGVLYIVVALLAMSLIMGRWRPPQKIVMAGAITGAVIPILVSFQSSPETCAPQSMLPAFINVSGYAVIALVLWMRNRLVYPFLVISLWAMGGIVLLSRTPPECRQALIAVDLNTLLVVPLITLIAFFGVRQAQREEARMRDVREGEIIEQARAEAEESFTGELATSVNRARDLIAQVAGGAQRDEVLRRELLDCDARIRASIQVDPQVSGPVGLTARTLVEHALSSGVGVTVRTIDSSEGAQPMPHALLRNLAVVVERAQHVTIQVTNTGAGDLLSLDVKGLPVDVVRRIVAPSSNSVSVEFVPGEGEDSRRTHILILCPNVVNY